MRSLPATRFCGRRQLRCRLNDRVAASLYTAGPPRAVDGVAKQDRRLRGITVWFGDRRRDACTGRGPISARRLIGSQPTLGQTDPVQVERPDSAKAAAARRAGRSVSINREFRAGFRDPNRRGVATAAVGLRDTPLSRADIRQRRGRADHRMGQPA